MLRPADSLPAVPICPGEITFPPDIFVVPRVSLARSSFMRPSLMRSLLMNPTNAPNSRTYLSRANRSCAPANGSHLCRDVTYA